MKNNRFIVRVSGQISSASFVGEFVIVYEYRDKMYQANSIEFQPYKKSLWRFTLKLMGARVEDQAVILAAFSC